MNKTTKDNSTTIGIFIVIGFTMLQAFLLPTSDLYFSYMNLSSLWYLGSLLFGVVVSVFVLYYIPMNLIISYERLTFIELPLITHKTYQGMNVSYTIHPTNKTNKLCVFRC